jgi:hypothetical protein
VPWPTALLILGGLVTAAAFLAFLVRFSAEAERDVQPAAAPASAAPPAELVPAT